MKQHYTRNTVSAEAWCKKCGKRTQHRVDQDTMQGRLGPCLVCIERLNRETTERFLEDRKQRELFASV